MLHGATESTVLLAIAAVRLAAAAPHSAANRSAAAAGTVMFSRPEPCRQSSNLTQSRNDLSIMCPWSLLRGRLGGRSCCAMVRRTLAESDGRSIIRSKLPTSSVPW